MEPQSSLAIQADGLEKTYGKTVQALRGVSLAVERGTVFGLLGPNGAGKSTAVRILTTLSRPDRGSATVAGYDIERDPRAVRGRIGCVAQKDGVDLEATGRENLLLQGRLNGMGGRNLKHRVDALLDRFALGEAAGRVTRTYSGGMLRKLSLAMGLVHEPEVLFLDEPTTGLDPEARAALWEEIRRLAVEEGVSVLLTTHYLDEADHLADRLAIIDMGRVVAEGTPAALKSELRGDAIQVEIDASATPDTARVALSRLNGQIRDLTVEARSLRARVDDGASAVPLVLSVLEDAGVAVASVAVLRPSLDDVYLRHTGRTFRATGEGEQR